jgi:hypothetical protein
MEFYTLISHEFQKSGLGMWRGELPCEAVTNDAHVSRFVVAPKGLFPRPWSASADCASFQEVSKQFHLLGQVVAKAIKDGRILDIPFSKAFYKLILGQVSLSLHPSICIHLLFFLCVYQKIISSFLRSLIYMTSSHLILSWQYPLWSFKPLLVGENMQSQI